MAAAAGGLGGAAGGAAGNGPGARPAAAAAVAGRAAGASGRRGQRDPRRERMQTAGRARRRGGIVSGGIPPLLPAPNLPGTSGGPGSGASKLWSWPGAHWPSCASPGSKGGRVPCEPGQTRVTGPGSRPARLPPRPRVWGASRRAAVGPAARGVLGGAGRRSPPIARCLPALSLPDSRPGKVSRKRDSAPRPPAPRAARRHCPSPSRGLAPWTRGLNHHLYPEPENGLTFRVSPWRSREASFLSPFISVLLTTSDCCCFMKGFPGNIPQTLPFFPK